MVDRIVIDASVVAKWFLKDEMEADVDLADQLLGSFLAGDGDVHAPSVLRYEICGLLTKACRVRLPSTGSPRLNKNEAIDLARDFFLLPIQFHDPNAEDELESMNLGIDHGKSYYDMSYVRLAMELACKCCLADLRVLGGVGPSFPTQHVVTLAQLLAP